MKVMIDENPAFTENYAEIHCTTETADITWAAKILRGCGRRLAGEANGNKKFLLPANIFYFESVDKKTFAYLENSVWETAITLKEAEEVFSELGFVRINKSTVVNVYRIDSIRSDFEMRSIILLENGENLVLNRRYRKSFQDHLSLVKEKLMGGANEIN